MRQELLIKEYVAVSHVLASAIPVLRQHLPKADPDLAEDLETLMDKSSFEKEPGLFGQISAETIISRSVDNFHSYMSDVLLRVFLARPETLRTGAKVEVREVLECESIQDFASRMAEKRVDDLAYGGFKAVRKYLSDRLGVEVDFDPEQLKMAVEAVAMRNIVVHNRGRVNERFRREAARTDLAVGDSVPLNVSDALASGRALMDVAQSIDDALIAKFGVQTFRY